MITTCNVVLLLADVCALLSVLRGLLIVVAKIGGGFTTFVYSFKLNRQARRLRSY